MPGSTAHGLPYPLGTEPVADGDDAIKALAEAVDAVLFGTSWTAITLQSSWVPYGSGYQTPQYRKKGDRVECRGLIRNGGPIGSPIFTLPAGFRPPATLLLAVHASQATGSVDIRADGTVAFASGGTAAFSLDFSFIV